MFDADRYITRGIADTIPAELQFFMWNKIQDIPLENRDYLQIFQLSIYQKEGQAAQEIAHSQEQPKYHARYLFDQGSNSPVDAKIFVIDDAQYSTMLLAEEY